MRNILPLLLVAVSLSACAFGHTYPYDIGDANFHLETENTIAVTVVDHRPYIVAAGKQPSFVGVRRALYGNPFDVMTSSGRPLAEDLANSIVDSMKKKNVNAVVVLVPHSATEATALRYSRAVDADRYVLLVLQEWKSITYFSTVLTDNVSLEVFDPAGALLADTALRGKENLGGDDARIAVETAVRQRLEVAFNDPEIVAALR